MSRRRSEAITSITSITSDYVVNTLPIDIDRFEGTHPEKLRGDGPTNAESVLKFLAANPEQVFTPKEIHESTDVARGSVGVVLSRLEKRELVRHRGEYWALADDTEPQKTITSMTTARAATDRLGPENPDDWGRASRQTRMMILTRTHR